MNPWHTGLVRMAVVEQTLKLCNHSRIEELVMYLLKGLQKTALLSTAVAVLAFGASTVKAADTVSDVAHASVSVGSTLSIVETTPIKFGNVTFTSGGIADGTLTMTPTGVRTIGGANSTGLALLFGSDNSVPSGDDAGSESPGFYAVSGATAAANIYISFAKTGSAAALIDANHPANQVDLTGPAGIAFVLDTLTFNSSGSDIYGNYITTSGGGTATVQVGGTVHTTAITATDGAYRGTFDIMASY
jgi:hypothetical protein